jgi:hypothetical protein
LGFSMTALCFAALLFMVMLAMWAVSKTKREA